MSGGCQRNVKGSEPLMCFALLAPGVAMKSTSGAHFTAEFCVREVSETQRRNGNRDFTSNFLHLGMFVRDSFLTENFIDSSYHNKPADRLFMSICSI